MVRDGGYERIASIRAEDVSRNLLRAQSAASRVPPKILTYAQVCSGFRLPPLLAAWAPRDDFWTHLDLAAMNEKDSWKIAGRSVDFDFLDEQRKEKLDEFFVRAALR